MESKQPDRKSTFSLMTIEDWSKSFDRILINGPPYSGKTTSFMTWPAPRQIIVAPGELGSSSILPDDPDDDMEFLGDQATTWKAMTWRRFRRRKRCIAGSVMGLRCSRQLPRARASRPERACES